MRHKKLLWSGSRAIIWILILHFLIRLYLAWVTDLGVDEVYYTQYAKYLDYGYFDHSPMVGWLIWLTTLGLSLSSEVAVRLSSLVLGSANLWLMYCIGKSLSGQRGGLLSALFFSVSIYASIIAGIFILPDTGQSFFWLLSIYFILEYQKTNIPKYLILFGITTGLALLSKYHSIFLWFGVILYILLHQRNWLKRWEIWASPFLSLLIFFPVLEWNLDSPWSGFGYHQGRVMSESWLPNFKYFFPELGGQIAFSHPAIFVLIIISIWSFFKNKSKRNTHTILLIYLGLPLIITTLFLSLYNRTLPHWAGPGYFSLMLVAASFWTEKIESKFLKKSLNLGFGLNAMIILFASVQITFGWPLGNARPETEDLLGRDDFTTDLSIWKETSKKLDEWFKKNNIYNPIIITHNWFPGAHLDWYFAQQYGAKLYVFGSVENQHQYLKINTLRGAIPSHSEVWYVTTSIYHMPPDERYLRYFPVMSPMQRITIKSGKKPRINIFLWKLSGNSFPVQVPIFQ